MALRHFLVQHYAGGMRVIYAGKYASGGADERRSLENAGWPAWGFVRVRAHTRAEAYELAASRLLVQIRCRSRCAGARCGLEREHGGAHDFEGGWLADVL